jgi:two-component system sensor histidine kinase ArlS
MKLNLHFLLRNVLLLILINIFLCLMVFSLLIWQSEKTTSLFLEAYPKVGEENRVLLESQHPDYLIRESTEEASGIRGILHSSSPLQGYDVKRSIGILKVGGKHVLKLSSLQYHMTFPNEELKVTYSIGKVLSDHRTWLYVLLIFQGLILLRGVFVSARSIGRTLKPLADMAQQAQSFSAFSGGTISEEEMWHLRNIAGTISSIDATKLDRRLPEDGPQNELKDLATAINSMLDRIDEAYRSQIRFVSDASHELRTPIAVVQGYANLLDRWGKNDPETMQEAIDAIKSESESMKDLIEQLLFIARGDNETMQLYPEAFPATDIVEETLREAEMIDSLHVFRSDIKQSAPIYADKQLIKQALRILLDNSIKYTPEKGEIKVTVSVLEEFVHITVQDNGIGIDPENLPYIFDRFYRSEESRARKTGGSGLGLSIMKWIIDRHSGKIEVISRKGIGTRTTIILPLATTQPQANENAVKKE